MHRIRRFEIADAAAMHALAAGEPLAAQWSVQSYDQLLESGYDAWVAGGPEGGALCGFVVTRTISVEAEILNVVTAPRCRRTGIGRALLDTALQSISLAGAGRVFLEVRASNVVAIAFYRKHGFAVSGSRPGYYPANEKWGAEAAVLMEKIATG